MYESQARRDSDIAAGAGRSAAELEADVETADDEFLDALADTTSQALDVRVPRLRVTDGSSGQQDLPVAKVPAMRLREIVLHHVDLDAGYTLADAPDGFVLSELAAGGVRFRHQPSFVVDAGEAGHWLYGRSSAAGDEPGPDVPRVSGTPVALLGWLSGRGDGSGLTCSSGFLPQLPVWG